MVATAANRPPKQNRWRKLGQDRYSDIVRLLLLTGQRRGAEIDFATGMIVLPAERVKNSREHSLPLSRQALVILERQPRRNSSDFVFDGFNDWDNAKQRLDQRLGIAPWRVHDLRRTCATNLGELGVQPHHIEAILNHYSGHRAALAGVYQRAKYEPEMRAALQKWADYVDRITAWGRGEQTHTAPYSRCATFPPEKNFSDRNTRPTVSHNLLKKCRPRPRSAIFGGGDTEIGAPPSYADESGPDFTADRFVHAMNARSATSSPAVA